MIDDFVLDDLQIKAVHDDIAVIWTDGLHDTTPPCVSVARRKIIMNLNWFNKNEFAFQLGHEMSHIYNDDPTYRWLYYSSGKADSDIERAANSGSLDLIVPYYVEGKKLEEINFVEFMNHFAIPSHLEELAKIKLVKYCY